MWFARRADEHELLDGEALDPNDVRANLRELAMLNRLPGGIGASFAAIRHLTDPARIVTVADVGTGAGDMPAAFVRRARAQGASWRVTAIDSRSEVVEVARRRLRKVPAVTVLEGNALALPLPDLSVDVAHASLLLHHFDQTDAVAALREMSRVSRRGVVINDLRRGLVPYLLTWTTTMALLFLGAPDHRIAAEALDRLKEEFVRLDVDTSKKVLKTYHARKAISPAVRYRARMDMPRWASKNSHAMF